MNAELQRLWWMEFTGSRAGAVLLAGAEVGDEIRTEEMSAAVEGVGRAIGSIAAIMTLQTGAIHPTINLIEADPECDLNYTPNTAAQKKVQTALCNAFGFGGNNASIVFTTL